MGFFDVERRCAVGKKRYLRPTKRTDGILPMWMKGMLRRCAGIAVFKGDCVLWWVGLWVVGRSATSEA